MGDGPGELLLTTDPGLEDVVRDELLELAAASELGLREVRLEPFGLPGQLRVTAGDGERLLAVARRLRTVHHLVEPRLTVELPPGAGLADVAAAAAAADLPELAAGASFRVTCHRSGDHPFTSMDVEREVGARLVARYGAPVDLEGYATEVRVDLRGRRLLVGVQLTRRSLGRRWPRVYAPRAALRATVAAAMVRLADPPRGGTLLDPFCGSGTIPLEAAAVRPDLEVLASDRDLRAASGCRANLEVCGMAGRIALWAGDARDLHRLLARRVHAIVTDPPYGVRVCRRSDFPELFRKFLRAAAGALVPGGTVVLLAFRRRAFRRARERVPELEAIQERVVETGGLHPLLAVLRRRAG